LITAKLRPTLLFVLVFLASLSCTKKNKDETVVANKANEPSKIVQENTKRVFFGHQSVGYNILSGVRRIAGTVQIIEITGEALPENAAAGIYHSAIGRNTDPMGKIAEFKKLCIDNGFGKQLDAAVLKLCFVDIERTTDVAGLFNYYAAAIDSIEKKHPALVVIPATIPLMIHASLGIKTKIKDFFLGDLNIKRDEFNNLVRRKYQGKRTVFDCAAIEALRPDGTGESFVFRGKTYDALYPGYSSDGGHLNEIGQNRVATEFIRAINNVKK
jgi:hypothetical protein